MFLGINGVGGYYIPLMAIGSKGIVPVVENGKKDIFRKINGRNMPRITYTEVTITFPTLEEWLGKVNKEMGVVYICPICAERLPTIVVESLKNVDSVLCHKCKNFVIPLATPQKEVKTNA